MERKPVYNIYCDESHVDNKDSTFLIIGGIFMERSSRNEIRNKINKIKTTYNFDREIKWTKVSYEYLDFYKAIIDLFFSYTSNELAFHCIVVDKSKVKYEIYHNNDKEEGFYKFYYQLLKNKFQNNCDYYIFLDFKPTKTNKRVLALNHYLSYKVLNNCSNSKIKKTQEYDSENNIFIQLADFFTGAVGFSVNYPEAKEGCKYDLQRYIASKKGKESLTFCSLPSESKFNIFCIKLY